MFKNNYDLRPIKLPLSHELGNCSNIRICSTNSTFYIAISYITYIINTYIHMYNFLHCSPHVSVPFSVCLFVYFFSPSSFFVYLSCVELSLALLYEFFRQIWHMSGQTSADINFVLNCCKHEFVIKFRSSHKGIQNSPYIRVPHE